MKINVGSLDRAARIVAGLAILSLVFILKDDTRWFGLIGFVPLLTGIFRFCPAYLPFGISTCKK